MILKDAVRGFYFYLRGNNHAEGTAKTYRDILEALSGQDFPLEAISLQSLQDHLSQFKDLSPSSLNVKKACLRSFFSWACDSDLLAKNPARMIKAEKIPVKEAAYLSLNEIKRLRKVIENPRDKLLFELFLNTGCRLSEIASLNTGDIRGKKSFQIIGKGKKLREIFLSPILIGLIGKSVNGNPTDSAVFTSYRGERLSSSAIQSLFKGYLKKAGIDAGKYHVHSLRHTFLTEIYRRTKDLRLTQELAGHSSPVTTARYAHLNEQDKRKAIQSLYKSGN